VNVNRISESNGHQADRVRAVISEIGMRAAMPTEFQLVLLHVNSNY
jgi:hypothetical protein